MKILLSAFAFAPNVGSEPGVGWRWAAELAKQHHVTVITDMTRRELVEADGVQVPPNVEVLYYRPRWLRSVPLNSTTAQLLYTLWQFGLLGFANRLHRDRRFELTIHITYSVFRHPSFLGFLGIPFIFGPLGGGEDAPFKLKRSIRGHEKLKEIIRAALNKIALFDPFLWIAYSKANLILTSTRETKNALPWPFRKRAVIYSNLGIDAERDIVVSVRNSDEPLRVLFAGRLLGWKGAHLAIRSVARVLDNGFDVDFTLLGDGPFEPELRRVAMAAGVHDRIRWIRKLSQQELFILYRSMHCLLFPSLHDSGGSVVLEAQANGLPVICLDLGGPATLVTTDTALMIKTDSLNEDQLVRKLASAIEQLAKDEERRRQMSEAAIVHASTMSWEYRVSGAMDLFERAMNANDSSKKFVEVIN